MDELNLWIENNLLSFPASPVSGNYVTIDSEPFYKISNYNHMAPFFMSLVSNADHWLFIYSNGGLSAGRKNENNSLFPYYTDDKIKQSNAFTGSKTIIHAQSGEKNMLWLPFDDRHNGMYQIERNLYKNRNGNKIIFEEINHTLNLCFNYSYRFSENYGFVKSAQLKNLNSQSVFCNVLDGLQNLLPYGVNSALQNQRSNLTDAYKRSELHTNSGLGIFSLSAMIIDRAEPAEALKATVCYSTGLRPEHILLSANQTEQFLYTGNVQTEIDIRATPGAYFVNYKIHLAAHTSSEWKIIADVNQTHSEIAAIIQKLNDPESHFNQIIEEDIETGNADLLNKVAMADGLQLTADTLATGRHQSNVLFNIMRGGLFEDNYDILATDFLHYLQNMNKAIAAHHADFLQTLPPTLSHSDLIEKVKHLTDADLLRLSLEYLPLSFSRRHGDPSRPWNAFSIDLKNTDGSSKKYYEGNWRDIFQNWEALAISFPGFIQSMIVKFLNASTIDGYNPYRITSDGIDWEVVEPDNPWSYIGYWGDHQIIYLLKLLEISHQYFPDHLNALLTENIFVYANVPYRIKSFDAIVANPKDTITFDSALEHIIANRINSIGADGKIVRCADENPLHASLAEKLLLTLLTKFSNYIPDAGIWLNTQRPEWNDANNALVGNGVSMVTLYYMRRYVVFLQSLFNTASQNIQLNIPVHDLLLAVNNVLQTFKQYPKVGFNNAQRYAFAIAMGKAGENYRNAVYNIQNEEKTFCKPEAVNAFLETALNYIDSTILNNKRNDGLYHAYNLIQFSKTEIEVSHLYEMLEGQVAVLSSGFLSADESLAVLNALKKSKIYRADQYSYMLYPDRQLPGFLQKNNVPVDFVLNSKLAQTLLHDGNKQLLSKDVNGGFHFNGAFQNANEVRVALDALKNMYGNLVQTEYDAYLDIFEKVFNHKSFTGRSGTFYGYEGLGCIYWHMVSKLLLATQETLNNAYGQNTNAETLGALVQHYYEIRAGIGINKSPDLYGAFPTDPYSHTPLNKGAQQPGMTGQVKEDIINRWAELGLHVADGSIAFIPKYLHPEEFLDQPDVFQFIDLSGAKQNLQLEAAQLAFTFCQVPVIYTKAQTPSIQIETSDGYINTVNGSEIPSDISNEIFRRTGSVRRINVDVVLSN